MPLLVHSVEIFFVYLLHGRQQVDHPSDAHEFPEPRVDGGRPEHAPRRQAVRHPRHLLHREISLEVVQPGQDVVDGAGHHEILHRPLALAYMVGRVKAKHVDSVGRQIVRQMERALFGFPVFRCQEHPGSRFKIAAGPV